jgi:hypothetical protein
VENHIQGGQSPGCRRGAGRRMRRTYARSFDGGERGR